MGESDRVTICDENGLAVCCIVCGHDDWTAYLMLPGGLRLKCKACGRSYGDKGIAAMTAALAEGG